MDKAFFEKTLDFVPYVKTFYENFIFSPVKVVKRVSNIPVQISQIFFPDFWSSTIFKKEGLTPVLINSSYLDSCTPETKEKLEHFVSKIEQIKFHMGICQKVKLYTSDFSQKKISVLGTSYSFSPIPVYFSTSSVDSNENMIDFLLNHKFTHIQKNDLLEKGLISFTILLVEIAVSLYFTPFCVPFLEGFFSLFENVLQKERETRADTPSISLNSEGAITFIEETIKTNKNLRKETENEFLSKDKENYFNKDSFFTRNLRKCLYLFIKDYFVSWITEEGNNRFDLDHPPLTKRLASFRKTI